MRLLSILTGRPPGNKVQHYLGLPPPLAGGSDQRTLMGTPAFVVIDETQDGVFLYRYDIRGECVGDTWHANIQDAKEQAAYEYEATLGEWQVVPQEIRDVVTLGVDICQIRRPKDH